MAEAFALKSSAVMVILTDSIGQDLQQYFDKEANQLPQVKVICISGGRVGQAIEFLKAADDFKATFPAAKVLVVHAGINDICQRGTSADPTERKKQIRRQARPDKMRKMYTCLGTTGAELAKKTGS